MRFSQLGPDGIILSVTGYVPSPRMVGATKSELLFNILSCCAQEVSLSSPQEVVFETAGDAVSGQRRGTLLSTQPEAAGR